MNPLLKSLLLALAIGTTVTACSSDSSTNEETEQEQTDDSGDSTDNSGDGSDSSGDSSGDNSDNSGDDSEDSSDQATNDDVLTAWIINDQELRSVYIMESDTSNGALVNVQSVEEETVSGAEYAVVNATGIPKYDVIVNQEIYDDLANRPLADDDFVGGMPTIEVGDEVKFGQNIGYNTRGPCESNAGEGYWPPGLQCPEETNKQGYFPKAPEATDEECETGLGVIGYWVNGTSVYNWGDGQSYNSEQTWWNLAPVAEQYDVDICGGHSANGDYHHHFYSSCLADLVSDDGSGHSPIYGFAADGYPIYGPWEADGVLAQSSWVTRDYSANSTTGCSDGQRSCTLNDPYDISQGTTSSSQGPDLGEVVTTMSGNQLEAVNGYYHEDYYWDQTLTQSGGTYLDQYNGHSDDTRGYHYHVTVTSIEGKLTPYYPYIIGDRFAGKLADNSVSSCSGQSGGGPGPRP